MWTRRPTSLRLIALAVIGFLPLACSGGTPGAPTAAGELDVIREADYIGFFNHPASFEAQDRMLQEAQNQLTERCLSKAGFDVRYPDLEVDQIVGQVTPQMAFRREWGYGFTAPKP